MLSVSKVSAMLAEFGVATATFGAQQVQNADQGKGSLPMASGYTLTDETYGRDSRLYIGCPDEGTRRRLERFLKDRGGKVDVRYHGSATVDVRVSYFQGHNWNTALGS